MQGRFSGIRSPHLCEYLNQEKGFYFNRLAMKDKFRAALQIIHNFVHEESDTLKMAPLRSNVEYDYFTVAFITRYIAYQLH